MLLGWPGAGHLIKRRYSGSSAFLVSFAGPQAGPQDFASAYTGQKYAWLISEAFSFDFFTHAAFLFAWAGQVQFTQYFHRMITGSLSRARSTADAIINFGFSRRGKVRSSFRRRFAH